MPIFIALFEIVECRFPKLTDDEGNNLLSKRLSKNTQLAITQAVNVLLQ